MRTIARFFSIFARRAVLTLAGSALLAPAAQATPTPNASPTITLASTPLQVGDVLTDNSGGWTTSGGAVTVSVQWLDCDNAGVVCTPISGAMSPTYQVAPSDVGVAVEVQETASDSTPPSAGPEISAPTSIVPPVNTVAPGITGTPQQGQTLSEMPGTWPGAQSVAIQWLDCDSSGATCSDVAANGTGSTYTLASGDVGFTIEVQEVGSNAGGPGNPANSLPTAIVVAPAPSPPVNQSPPTISGTPQQGQTLTETNGTWTNSPTSFTYHWQRCDSTGNNCANIHSATHQTYTPTSADVGNTIDVEETASNGGGAGTPANSATTPVITPPPPVNTARPRISGTTQEGQTLSEGSGTWTNNPTSFSYQWEDCDSSGGSCSDVATNGRGQTYVVTAADVGSTIEVQETATNAGGSGNAATSVHTGVVIPAASPPPVNITPPTISGTPQQGQTLTEINGTWTNNPTSFVYHWQRCDSSGNNCANIFNATGQTYTLTSADVGNTIEVEEIASNGGGAGTPADTAPTAIIGPPSPVNQALPTIIGATQQGQTLTEIDGTWSGASSLSHQWLACDSSGNNCSQIPNATGPTYAPTAALLGDTVEVQETASNAGGPSTVSSLPTAGITLNPSSTILLAQPGNPVTNQSVTLIATVTTSFGPAPPAGDVTFDDGGTPISGCSAVTVSTFNLSVPATCQTTFSAGTSPHALTATFTPNSGAGIAGSTSASLVLPVAQAQTSTSLDVSNPTVFTGSKAAYTATVATVQGAPVHPTGSVQFTDNGKSIASCARQALVQSQGLLSAQCTVRYRKSGRHTITARYNGDGSFSASTSPSRPVRVQSQPTSIAGAITAKTYWTVFFTPTYTRFLKITVHKPSLGTTILLMCHGRGCPFARQSVVVTPKACRSNPRCVTENAQLVNIVARLHGRRLRVGTVLTIELIRPRWIGKAYVIQIRSGKGPRDQIRCLAPGSTRPGVGC